MSTTLLILRVVAGLLFAGHGAQKLFGWFGGGGIDGTAPTFEKLGLRPARLQATAAGCGELGGGLLLAVGLLMPLAAALIVAIMTAAVVKVHWKNGPWVTDGGWELNALYGVIAFAVTGIGAGDVSLDHALSIEASGVGWALAGLLAGVMGGFGAVAWGQAYAAREPDSAAASH